MLGYVNEPVALVAIFEPSASAVSYKISGTDGTIHTAETTSNIVNQGNGIFSIHPAVTFSTKFKGAVIWKCGEQVAVEDINIIDNTVSGGVVKSELNIELGEESTVVVETGESS